MAVLVFLIFMAGKEPYVTRNGKKGVESIKNMQFPYVYKEHHLKGVPDGVWCFMWSHLYIKLTETFYETFQAGESRNLPADRYDEEFWLSCLKEYYQKSVLLFPSYLETAGLPLLEAKAYGAQIIAADCRYAQSVLCGYEDVCYFHPDDSHDLAGIMRTYIEKLISEGKYEE